MSDWGNICTKGKSLVLIQKTNASFNITFTPALLYLSWGLVNIIANTTPDLFSKVSETVNSFSQNRLELLDPSTNRTRDLRKSFLKRGGCPFFPLLFFILLPRRWRWASLSHVNEGRHLGRVSGAMGRKGSGCCEAYAKLDCPTSSPPPVTGEKLTSA